LGAVLLTIAVIQLAGILKVNSVANAQAKDYVEDAKSHPRLVADYSHVTALRIASRKASYRMGEMITIDLALLNVADRAVFFHKLEIPSVELRARDEVGNNVRIIPPTTILEGITRESYSIVEPGEILVKSFVMIVRCVDKDQSDHYQAMQKLNEDEREGRVQYQRGLFERNLFVNWGDGCIDVSRPGKYYVTAEVSNENVVLSKAKTQKKTAIGTLKSGPLAVTITQ